MRRVVERFRKVGKQCAQRRLAVQTVLAVGQEQAVGSGLVEGGAMADRGEHIEQRLVLDGGVIRGGARHQRDVRRLGDRRALRDQPSIRGMPVIAHQHRHAVAPETLPHQLRIAQCLAPITVHKSFDNSTARPADERDAIVQLRGINTSRLTLDQQGRRRQSRPPSGERPSSRPQRSRPLWRRQSRALMRSGSAARVRSGRVLPSRGPLRPSFRKHAGQAPPCDVTRPDLLEGPLP